MVTTDRKHYKMLIGGEQVDADKVFEIVSPATEEVVATVAHGSIEHADQSSRQIRQAEQIAELLVEPLVVRDGVDAACDEERLHEQDDRCYAGEAARAALHTAQQQGKEWPDKPSQRQNPGNRLPAAATMQVPDVIVPEVGHPDEHVLKP